MQRFILPLYYFIALKIKSVWVQAGQCPRNCLHIADHNPESSNTDKINPQSVGLILLLHKNKAVIRSAQFKTAKQSNRLK